MIRRYETIFVSKAELDEETRKNLLEKLKAIVTGASGTVHHSECFGKQKLAYELAGDEKGGYHYFAFEAEGTTLKEVERFLRLNETVVKFQSFRVDGDFDPRVIFFDRSLRAQARVRGRGGDMGGRGDDDMYGSIDEGAGPPIPDTNREEATFE